jgi:hypothetical protein
MDQPVEPVQVTLVTIVAPFALQDRLIGDLKAAGAIEYTLTEVDPRGRLGHRAGSIPEAGPVRIETLVTLEQAQTIFEHVGREFADVGVVAFCRDVEAPA